VRALAPALVLGLLPLGNASAQTYPFVRVTKDKTAIRSTRANEDVRMRAPKGTVLEVIHIEGDSYNHRDSNWYWVLLPLDNVGTRPAGWIRGHAVEHVPAPAAPVAEAGVTESPAPNPAPSEAHTRPDSAARSERSPVERPAAGPPFTPDVVLHFPFGKSHLTEEARQKLASAVARPRPAAQGMSVVLEGHADWIGPETYNETLGLARAESVRRYLAEAFRIPAGEISVVSYGETSPAASNATREGRAQNRRVVVKVGE
jgi:outer membrane protein OmpA-like peptidoglycan-associated protein